MSIDMHYVIPFNSEGVKYVFPLFITRVTNIVDPLGISCDDW